MTSEYRTGMRVSEYVLEERVGTGTFGEVWCARHHVWENEHVAVKLPTEPEYVRYLQREGVVVHGLRHANIIRVMGMDPYAEVPYLVMELVKGPSLRQVLHENPMGIPVDLTVVALRGILNAMVVAHGANVLHRDLKPGNVLLHLDGKPLSALTIEAVKVGDFGLGIDNADTLRSIVQSASVAREDKLVGTLAYMAPEIREGRQKPDARSDLYSIGVILFELLTGDRPAGAEFPSTLRPNVPPALDEVFRRLYARHDRRYESAQAVLDDLTARLDAQRGAPATSPPPVPLPPLPTQTAPGKCPSCGHAVEAGDQFCTQCRAQLVGQVRQCPDPACRAYPGPHDRYCIFCGTALVPRE